jgi:permease
MSQQHNNECKGELKMVTLQEVLNLVTKFATVGGGLWLVWGVIVLAGALKDKNGPGLQAGIWQIVGGGLIIAAAALFANITAA